MFFDIHTHVSPTVPSESIFSCRRNEPIPSQVCHLSAGIHPWYLTTSDLERQTAWIDTMLSDPRTVALGEAGLDKLCETPYALQETAFRFVAGRADKYRLPLIIHAVKSVNEIIALKKELKPSNAWIIHGFRGKKALAESLLKHGCYLSFGFRFPPETLQGVPTERLLFETDESPEPISALYETAASLRGVSPEHLDRSVRQTVNRLFFSR